MSWRPQVKVQGEWGTNSLVFATEAEARAYAKDLFQRWTLCSDHGAVESDAEVTHEWSDTEGLGPVGGPKRFPATRVSL